MTPLKEIKAATSGEKEAVNWLNRRESGGSKQSNPLVKQVHEIIDEPDGVARLQFTGFSPATEASITTTQLRKGLQEEHGYTIQTRQFHSRGESERETTLFVRKRTEP